MTGFKTLIAASLMAMTAATSANAQQLPTWAMSHPGAYEAQYPNRDILNGGALTPAGRMGLELAHGAAPVFRTNNAHAEMGGLAK
jgi:hypothetical protein